MNIKIFHLGRILILLVVLFSCSGKEDWGSVTVINEGNRQAVLENSIFKCTYGRMKNNKEDAIVEIIIKESKENQALSRIDACAGRQYLTQVKILSDELDRKIVEIEWFSPKRGTLVQQVSIFPDKPYLKIDYIKYGVNIVDIASPGDTTNGQYVFYGADSWHRPYIRYPNSYYNRFSKDVGKINVYKPDPEDGGCLNYHGYFIMGVFNPKNKRGYGRVMPVKDINIIKLLTRNENRGFELFHHYGEDSKHRPVYSGYLMIITGGEDKILSLGKKIVDEIVPLDNPKTNNK